MSRTIAEIQNSIITNKNSYTELNDLNSPSQTAKWRLFTYIVAVAISFLEQIIDIFKVEIEAKLVNKVSGTSAWIKNNLLLFQYDATTPQIVEIDDNYNISYPVYNSSLQLIKQVALEVLDNNLIQIKVAKQTPPVPLSALEKTAVEGYLDEIMPAGIQTTVISEISDKILIKGTIYFNGMYSAIIQTNVETAINNYLENLPFGGKFVVSELQDKLMAVAGVNDIDIDNIQARRDNQTFSFGGNTQIYQLVGTTDDVNNRFYNTFAGYVTPETTSGYTLSNMITYTAS